MCSDQSEVHFNDEVYWVKDCPVPLESVRYSQVAVLRSVATHEIGHAIGIK